MQQKIYLNLKEKLENSLNKGLFFILKIFLDINVLICKCIGGEYYKKYWLHCRR